MLFRSPGLCPKGWGSRERSEQDRTSCMSLHSGPGGDGSEKERLQGSGEGLLCWPRPPPPRKSPSGRRRRLERRKHFLIPEAATHGRRGRRPPPAAARLGTQIREVGAFPDSHSRGLSPQSSLPRPAERSPTRRRWCAGSGLDPGSSGGAWVPAISVAWLGKTAAPLRQSGNRSSGCEFAGDRGSTLCQRVWGVSLPICKVGSSQDEEKPARDHSPPRR